MNRSLRLRTRHDHADETQNHAITRARQARKLSRGLRTVRGREALKLGVAATGSHRALLARLAPVSVIDVGANQGQFALDVESAVPGATVISFEPMPEAVAVYRSLFSQNPRYSIRDCALGSATGISTLHVSVEDDSSSLLCIGAGQIALFPDTAECGQRLVRVEPLDEVVEPGELNGPALLKIDVQGYELEVLRGATRTLQSVRWVYVECSFAELYDEQPLAGEIVGWLHERGFQLSGIGSVMSARGRVIQSDLLFERRTGPSGSVGNVGVLG